MPPHALAIIAVSLFATDVASAEATTAERHAAAIRAVAKAYLKWGRVDERPNLAPELCRAPRPEDYGKAAEIRLSQADGPHHDKLYYLWASDKLAYLGPDKKPFATGFAIVKESFVAKSLESKPPASPTIARDLAPIGWLEHDGKLLGTGARKELFVMTKVDGAGTDDGWIYGTVTPDGKVTSAGRVETCMKCHDEAATHERVFGLATK